MQHAHLAIALSYPKVETHGMFYYSLIIYTVGKATADPLTVIEM